MSRPESVLGSPDPVSVLGRACEPELWGWGLLRVSVLSLSPWQPNCAFYLWQNRPLQDVPLWHVNYFELKAIEILSAREKLLPLP